MQFLIKYLDKINAYQDATRGLIDFHPEVAHDFEMAIKQLQTLAEIEAVYNIIIHNREADVNGAFVQAQRLITLAKNHVKYEFK